MTMLNERIIAGYSTFTGAEEFMDSTASAPAVSPTVSVVSAVVSIGGASFASGFTVAWTVDTGC
jgi:hypothetical protein